MNKLLLFIAVSSLLLQTIAGLLPLKHLPHDHLLLGTVTPEELRAHEASEALDLQPPVDTTASSTPAVNLMQFPSRGLIISVAPGFGNLMTVLHLEVALGFLLTIIAPLGFVAISILRAGGRTFKLPALDPPPRLLPIPF